MRVYALSLAVLPLFMFILRYEAKTNLGYRWEHSRAAVEATITEHYTDKQTKEYHQTSAEANVREVERYANQLACANGTSPESCKSVFKKSR